MFFYYVGLFVSENKLVFNWLAKNRKLLNRNINLSVARCSVLD